MVHQCLNTTQPPYLAHCYSLLFPKLEMFAQATNFQSNNNIYNKMAVSIKGPKK